MHRRKFLSIAGVGTVSLTGYPIDAAGETDSPSETGFTYPYSSLPVEGSRSAEATDEDATATLRVGELLHGQSLAFVVTSVQQASVVDSSLATSYLDARDGRETIPGIAEADRRSGLFVDESEESIFRATDDAEFVGVELALQNISTDSAVTFQNELSLTLQSDEDEHDNVFPVSGWLPRYGELTPGEVERVKFAYVIPQDATDLKLDVHFPPHMGAGADQAAVDLERDHEAPQDVEQQLQTELLTFGQGFETNGVRIDTTSLSTGDNLGPFLEPATDHEYVVLGAKMENETGQTKEFVRGEHVSLKDGQGRRYLASENPLLATQQFDLEESLGQDERREGEFAYHLEKGVDELYWSVDLSLWEAGSKTMWQLR